MKCRSCKSLLCRKNFFNGTLKCSNYAKLAGVVRGLGVHEAGEIRKHQDKMIRNAQTYSQNAILKFL